jgi:DNA-binding IclR family transcriptional regulator
MFLSWTSDRPFVKHVKKLPLKATASSCEICAHEICTADHQTGIQSGNLLPPLFSYSILRLAYETDSMTYEPELKSAIAEASTGTAADERYLVPALVRGLGILSTLSSTTSSPTLSEVAASLGVTRSSAYRLLYTLSHLGFVEYDSRAKTYALGPQVLALGYGYLASRDILAVSLPHLERLRDRTGWSAHLGELHGCEVLYLARVPTRRPVSSTVHVGTRLPAHATSMGRVLLSGLTDDEIRQRYQEDSYQEHMGRPLDLSPYSSVAALLKQIAEDRLNGAVVQNAVYEAGVASVAAPIRDVTNRVVGAINISAVSTLVSKAELDGPLKEEVVAAAALISRDLGRQNPQ